MRYVLGLMLLWVVIAEAAIGLVLWLHANAGGVVLPRLGVALLGFAALSFCASMTLIKDSMSYRP